MPEYNQVTFYMKIGLNSKEGTWRKTGPSRLVLLATNEGDEKRWHGQDRNPSYSGI